MPLISIITVSAFDTQRLQKTMDSLSDIISDLVEHVVIHPSEDGKTQSILDSVEYSNSYRRSYVDFGIGIYPAMNIGVTKAKGHYIWFINSGDELITRDFGQVLCVLEKNRPTWIIGKGKFDWREEQKMDQHNLLGFLSFNENSFISHQTVITKTQILRELGGFDVRYKVAADTDLIARLNAFEEPAWFMKYIVRVEKPEYASKHNRRARLESIILSIRLQNRKSFLKLLNREFSNAFKRVHK